jgi:RNA methyltransferase, TrmH family
MVSKNWLKIVKSLQNKKFRKEHQLFFAEGAKIVLEFLASSFQCKILFVTNDFLSENQNKNHTFIKKTQQFSKNSFPIEIATEAELLQMGTMQSNNACLGVFEIPEVLPLSDFVAQDEWTLALDNIQDPGNLGTILRICDWYGIKKVVCNAQTVDCYNPKTINATMGSLARVKIIYTQLTDYLHFIIKNTPTLSILGTFMDGIDIHTLNFKVISSGIIVMGNEANGIGTDVSQLITERITIPRFGEAESLNVGIATAIVLDNLRR